MTPELIVLRQSISHAFEGVWSESGYPYYYSYDDIMLTWVASWSVLLLTAQLSAVQADGGTGGGDDTVILVVGGYDDRDISYTEVIVLPPNGDVDGTTTCDKPADFPYASAELFGLLDSAGRPLVCGGEPDEKTCYRYLADEDAWVKGPSTVYDRTPPAASARLPDGRQWVVGGGSLDTVSQNSTEYFDGETFSVGPDLPIIMNEPCAVEVGDGSVFVVDYVDPYLFDSTSEVFTPLPKLPESNGYLACGVVNPSPLGSGIDIVVAMDSDQPAYSYNTASAGGSGWRAVDSPFREDAPSVKYGRTFVTLGGWNPVRLELDTILMYDPETEEWITREETLDFPKRYHAAFTVSPDVLNCRRTGDGGGGDGNSDGVAASASTTGGGMELLTTVLLALIHIFVFTNK